MSYDALVERGSSSFKIVERDRSDTGAVLYTGGTTGTPKGVMLTHENLMTSIHNVAHHERSTAEDSVICFLPLNHVFGQIHIMNATVYSGGSIMLLPAFDLDRVLHLIQRHRVTKFYGVPTIYVRFLELKNLKEHIGSLRYCFSAAASMAAELVREWKARTGLDIYEAYGMTESASMVTYNHYYRHVIGSVGTPVNTIEVQVRDADGNTLGMEKEGEICIRGPNIMKGYLNNPEETRSAFWGSWFRSGDVGMIDEEGYLYIVDRLKDMIITGGENVYPREIEEILYTIPEVKECTVIGLPDREYGERVTALIIPKPGQPFKPDDLKSYLKTKLSPYKIPKEFISVTDLPKSSAGKILKRELKQKILQGRR
jgi:long-chain acyl-CoA synthetase